MTVPAYTAFILFSFCSPIVVSIEEQIKLERKVTKFF